MKTILNTLLGATLTLVTLTTFINVEAAFAVLAAAGILIIAVQDYGSHQVGSVSTV